MATVVVNNWGDASITIGGVTFVAGNNNIDSDTLFLMAELGLLDGDRGLPFDYDLSAMEP